MMKTITLVTLILISLSLNAQVFAPEEAVWYYTFDPDITLDDGYQKIEVAGDTTVNDKLCKILQRTNIGYSYWHQKYYETDAGKIFIYEEDSVVYFKKDSLFYILYDFSAKVGDSFYSMSLISSCNEPFLIEIDSITTIDFDGVPLKKFHFGDEFYLERIGYPDYMFMFQIPCEPITGPNYPGPLRCYSDNIVGNLSTHVVSSCDYITSSNQPGLNSNSIKIYPNPSQKQECINIEIVDKNVTETAIFNALGQLIKSSSVVDNRNTKISIRKSGNYIVCFKDKNDKIVYCKKILIE